MKAGAFRTTQWDPLLLITQIICIQSSLYFTLGILVLVGSLISGTSYGLDLIFEYHVSVFHKQYLLLINFSNSGDPCNGFGWPFDNLRLCQQCFCGIIGSMVRCEKS